MFVSLRLEIGKICASAVFRVAGRPFALCHFTMPSADIIQSVLAPAGLQSSRVYQLWTLMLWSRRRCSRSPSRSPSPRSSAVSAEPRTDAAQLPRGR